MHDNKDEYPRGRSPDVPRTGISAWILSSLGAGGLYFFAAQAGWLFAPEPDSFVFFWPANGILLALLLIGGKARRIPILLGAFMACVASNSVMGKGLPAGFGMSVVNILEILFTEVLLRRFAGGPKFLDGLRETFLFFCVVSLAGPVPGALLGAGIASVFMHQGFWESFRIWWLVDASGIAIFTPAVISWQFGSRDFLPGVRKKSEFAACLLLTFGIGYIVFGRPEPLWRILGNPLPFLLFPALLWSSLRFGIRGGTAGLTIVYATSVWFTGRGSGPFVAGTGSEADILTTMHIFPYAAAFCSVLPAVLFDSRMRAESGLRKWESRYRHLWKNKLVGVYISDIDGSVSDANDAFLGMVDYTREELMAGSLRLRDLATPEYLEKSRERVERFRKDGYLEPYEREWELRDGRRILTVMFASQLEEPDSILCMVMDVTELKRTQEDLRRKESRYNSLMASNLAGVYITDLKGRVREANDTFLSMIGYSRSELDEGKVEVLRLTDPENVGKVETRLQQFNKEGQVGPFEREWTLRDGRKFLGVVFAIRLENPELALCMVIDVSDSNRVKQELKRTENLYQSLVDSNIIGVAVVGKDGVFHSANDAYLGIIGYDRLDIQAGSLTVGTLRAEAEGAGASLAEAGLSGSRKLDPTEAKYRRKDGTIVFVYRGITHLEESDRYLVVAMDMTHLKRVQAEYEASKMAAEAATLAKSRFLAHMSHEIRTPLNGMIGMSSLLLETDLNEEQLKYARAAQSSGEHLLSLVNRVLDISKIEHDKLELEKVPFALSRVIDGAIAPLVQKAVGKGVDIVVDIEADVPARFIGDPIRLQQVLMNLVDNAVKFSERCEVILSVRARDSREGETALRFEVRDCGVGMSREIVARLFQPFQQGDSSMARKVGGTGLGLAISKGLVELMGGGLTVDSEPGSGSLFGFTVRFGHFTGAVVEDLPEVSLAVVRPSVTATAAAVLVVDDNPINLEVTSAMLSKMGCKVESAERGNQALAMLAAKPFDLILLDLEMPDMDGFEALKRIHASEAGTRRTPVVAVTANAVAGTREHCLQAGMEGYVSKPFSFQSLYLAIRPWLPAVQSVPPQNPVRKPPVSGPGLAGFPSMDWSRLDGMIEGNPKGPDTVRKLVRLFIDVTRSELASIRAYAAAGDSGKVKSALHKLRGGCATIGARALVEISAAMETSIEGAAPGTIPELSFDLLEAEYRTAAGMMMERYIGPGEGTSAEGGESRA